MGVTQDKGRIKPRPLMAAQRPSSPRVTSGTAPAITVRTTVASAPPVHRKEEEYLHGTSAQSSEKSTIITDITNNNTNKTKVVLAASKAKDSKKSEEENDNNKTEKSLILALNNISLNEDNDLNKQIQNLSIKDSQQEKEQSEESDLVSRGPDRICTKGIIRTAPYLHQQHILSSDKHGGGTVMYPNISTANTAISFNQEHHRGFFPTNLQNSSIENRSLPIENDFNDYNSELENLIPFSKDLPQLNAEDVIDVLSPVEDDNSCSSLLDSVTIDKIIERNRDDKAILPIKQELWEHLPPTPPESDSDECPVGSPSSVSSGTSGTSGLMRTDKEKIVTMSAPYTQVATQPTNLHSQTGFAPASNAPVIQTLPVQLVVLREPVMPPPVLPQLQPQLLAPPSTPPPSPQGLRPILPGINIPPACNRCSEPAINRIRSVMLEETKGKAWAVMFTHPESMFTDEDEDGNMLLSRVLSNWQKIKTFMEVLYALIQRLKGIINRNFEMACKLLAKQNKHGQAPLDIACRFLRSSPQNALAVRYLADTMVEEGIAIGEEVDGNGNSLLHRLCLCGDEACYIMAELLSMKNRQGKSIFDVNKKNNEGKTALHIAAQTHNERTSCAVLAQLLMRSGADVSVKEGCAGNTVFHLVARESCDPNLLLTLLAKTSYASKVINEKNFNEDTPLHMVAANHTISPTRQRLAVQHMIDYGADPKLQNKSRKAPLSLVPVERKQDIKNVLYQKRQVTCHE